MGRRKKAKKRTWNPDPVYGRVDVTRFINHIMRHGKKSLAQRIFYKAMEIVKEKTKKDPILVWEEAIKNVSPQMEVRPERSFSLACRWIIEAARNKKGKPMFEKLAQEIIDAASKRGDAYNRKEMMHKTAEANKAFAIFAWGKSKKT